MRINHGSKNFYLGDSESKPLAEMTYTNVDEHTLIVDRTFVSEELRGQNIARKLLQGLTAWAREENKKIIPLCPFAKAEMAKNPDYADLLKESTTAL